MFLFFFFLVILREERGLPWIDRNESSGRVGPRVCPRVGPRVRPRVGPRVGPHEVMLITSA